MHRRYIEQHEDTVAVTTELHRYRTRKLRRKAAFAALVVAFTVSAVAVPAVAEGKPTPKSRCCAGGVL